MQRDRKDYEYKFVKVVRPEVEEAKIRASVKKEEETVKQDALTADHEHTLKNAKIYKQTSEILKKDKEKLGKKNGKNFSLNHNESSQAQLANADKTEEISLLPEDKWTYKNLRKWIDINFKGKLVLTKSAINALNKVARNPHDYYTDSKKSILTVYEWINFLGTEYRQNKLGNLDKKLVEKKAKDIGIKNHDNLEAPPITKQQKGRLKNKHEYDVLYKGNWRFMDFHLKKGVITDKRKCLRIYYFWDEEDEVVVIGHLPWHLETPNSN